MSVIVALSCIISEIKRDIGRKSRDGRKDGRTSCHGIVRAMHTVKTKQTVSKETRTCRHAIRVGAGRCTNTENGTDIPGDRQDTVLDGISEFGELQGTSVQERE